jgi:hypothetical protein
MPWNGVASQVAGSVMARKWVGPWAHHTRCHQQGGSGESASLLLAAQKNNAAFLQHGPYTRLWVIQMKVENWLT